MTTRIAEGGKRRFEELSSSGGGYYYYYGVCALGGMLSAATTHLLITPLDVLKVNIYAYASSPLSMLMLLLFYNICMYSAGIRWTPSNIVAFSLALVPCCVNRAVLHFGEVGLASFFGYGVQGGCKFGLYEYFKRFYDCALVNHNNNNKTAIFFLSSASAQIFADVALCPFEAVKVRVQTQPNFAKGLLDGFPKLYVTQGFSGFFRGIFPLWGRNLPFSMVMFSTFEHSVDLIYRNIIQKRKEDCSKVQQLSVTCLAGYAAGAVGTIISNPADNIVSSLYNNRKAETAIQVAKNIGFVNLFTRSLSVRMIIVGPVMTLQWFFYDGIKVLSGLPPSGGLSRSLGDTTSSTC